MLVGVPTRIRDTSMSLRITRYGCFGGFLPTTALHRVPPHYLYGLYPMRSRNDPVMAPLRAGDEDNPKLADLAGSNEGLACGPAFFCRGPSAVNRSRYHP